MGLGLNEWRGGAGIREIREREREEERERERERECVRIISESIYNRSLERNEKN